MMYWIIKENKHDKEFIEKRTKGFDDLKKMVEKYADVEEITGVPTETRPRDGAEVRRSQECSDHLLPRYHRADDRHGQRPLARQPLDALRQHRARRASASTRSAARTTCRVPATWARTRTSSPATRSANAGDAEEDGEGLGRHRPSGRYGVTLTEQITQCGDPIKAMYILGLNPVVSYPDSNHVMRSLEKLDFLVVQDIFPTETTKYADVILPGACFAEKDGTFTERRAAHQPCPEGRRPARAMPRQTGRSSSMLAKKMGLKGFDFKSAEDVWDDMRAVTPSMFGATYAEDGEAGVRPLALPHHRAPGHADPAQGEVLGRRWPGHLLRARVPAACGGRGRGVSVHPDDRAAHLPLPHEDPDRTAPRSSTTRSPRDYVQINTEDAKRLGIKEGSISCSAAGAGSRGRSRGSPTRSRPASCMMAMHFPNGANNLTNTALDPLSKMPELKHCAVAVEKIAEAK